MSFCADEYVFVSLPRSCQASVRRSLKSYSKQKVGDRRTTSILTDGRTVGRRTAAGWKKLLEIPEAGIPGVEIFGIPSSKMAVSWEFPGIPIQGGSLQLQVLFCDVTLKFFVISGAVQSPCALALPVPDVHVQLANSKPVLDERGCKEHRQCIRFGEMRALLFGGSLK